MRASPLHSSAREKRSPVSPRGCSSASESVYPHVPLGVFEAVESVAAVADLFAEEVAQQVFLRAVVVR